MAKNEQVDAKTGGIILFYFSVHTGCCGKMNKGKTFFYKSAIVASITIQNKLLLATLNKKDFENIPGLALTIPVSFE